MYNLMSQPFPILAVTNRSLCSRPFLSQVERICQARPAALILREKDLSPEEYKILAFQVLSICRQYQVPCILHTFWQEAAALGCPAIHLPLPLLRSLGGKPALGQFQTLGTSIHSVEEAVEAVSLGASYVTAGHIFATDCKKGLPPRGLSFLKEICETVSIPVHAIGGITFDKTQWNALKEQGASGACIMSGMMKL